MSWLNRAADGSVVLTLHIQPGAKKTEIAGLHGDALKIRLAAPPVDGKANAALIAFLAKACGMSKSSVELVSGDTSRSKRVRVCGADPVLFDDWASGRKA
ncbi:MAG: YggU family protein [Zoogloea sp.]|nr:YggU family protein [Zoogloea sp.]